MCKYLFYSLVILNFSAYADHGALQHRVHHGPYSRGLIRQPRDHGAVTENEVIDEEPNGRIDFSKAVEQADGSLCVTKTKYMEKLEKQQVGYRYNHSIIQRYVTEGVNQ